MQGYTVNCPGGSNVTSVQRALAFLETLDTARRGLNISELSRRLQVPKSTAHVIIRTLESEGYVIRDRGSRTYALGLKAYSLGRETIRNMVLPKAALPHLRWLANKTQLTVHLAVRENNQAVYVQKVDGPSLVRFDTFAGKRTSLHCTAVGKTLLSYSPDTFQREFLSKTAFARYTRKTIFSPGMLRHALSEIRRLGYAFDDQEEELDVRCLAVPVFRCEQETLAAISVAGTVEQLSHSRVDEFVRLLQMTARVTAESASPAAVAVS